MLLYATISNNIVMLLLQIRVNFIYKIWWLLIGENNNFNNNLNLLNNIKIKVSYLYYLK